MNSSSPKWRGRPARRLLLPSILILVSCLWILVSPPTLAIVDTNNNTLSDLWEQSFNNGSLFPNIDPQADPDADGWTNAQEDAAGTNPFDPNPPDGFLLPQITTIPATTTTPETHVISWPARWGKQYTLLASPDLTPESWLPVGQPIPGQDNAIQIATQLGTTVPARFFWRVAVTDVDTDNDGLTNAEEHELTTNPNNPDTDGDEFQDDWEVANGLDPNDATGNNGKTGDPDGDGLSNLLEQQHGTAPLKTDTDNDGLFDGAEINTHLTNPINPDTDYDGMPDGWETSHGFNPTNPADAVADADHDGYTNREEYTYGKNPHLAEDTDNDGMPDGWEIHNDLNPAIDDTSGDPDQDGLTNLQEYQAGTNPTNPDSDSDGMPDGWEVQWGLNPLSSAGTNGTSGDLDGDGLSNFDEWLNNCEPNNLDTDADGANDALEVAQASDPNFAGGTGQPPTDQVQEINFKVYGDYASWGMKIQGEGPRDYRLLMVVTPDVGVPATKPLKLHRNNKYKVTLRHTRSKDAPQKPWYCWEASVENKPGVQTFQDYTAGRIPGVAEFFSAGDGHWLVDNRSGLFTAHNHRTEARGGNAAQGLEAFLIPVEIKVTDFTTKSDAVPYSATPNAAPPKNSELCLKADTTNEKAKIEIELPSITDATMLSKMKWKVVKKPADTMVSEGVFGGATPPSVELPLANGSSVEDEVMFEVQVGVDDTSFATEVKLNVRVVRDRLNWWFEPFSSDFGWRTARPEPRADTGDYPAHKANAYQRESLQSVYEFFKSSTAIGPSTPKTNWVKPSITCFGQFHDALKTSNGNNPLVDLNSLARIDMTAVTQLASFDLKYGAVRSALGKQTTYPSDANPTLRATQFPERVQFATTAAAAVGDANLTRARLMALWTREGSMDVSSQHTRTGYNPWPLGFGAAVSAAPASEADAKAIFIYDVAYICLGSDFLLKHSGGADNEPDLRDYAAALAHFETQADATGGAGIGNRIVSNLTATPLAGVAATATASITSGSVTSTSISNGSSGYATAPAVYIGVAPSGGVTATATATITNGVVSGITITNAGSGYTSAPTVTIAAPTIYTIAANESFYEDMLTLAGKHFVSVWQAEGPDATYMAYNMGVAKFNQMKATLTGASYPERGRLGLMDWAIHYEIRSGEWDQPRDFAQKFHAYRMAFEAKYP